jgi:hypothetical protein
MAFTYLGDLSTNRDKVRFFIGDKVPNGGPRPGDGNYTDAEIDGALAVADSWHETVADLLDTLATEWVRYPSFQADNFSISRSHIAKNFQGQAEAWRKQHGLASPQKKYGAPGSEPITRVDAYSTDKDSVTE